MKLILLTGALLASAFGHAEDIERVATSNNNFGFNLFKLTQDSSTEENIMLSPISATAALTMTLNGADENTKTEIEKALSLSGNDYLNNVSLLLKSLQSPKPAEGVNKESAEVLSIANAIWTNKDIYTLDGGFASKVNELYNFSDSQESLVRNESFNQDALDNINAWVSANTNKMIPTILEKLSPDDAAVLLNALFFQAQWYEKFKVAEEKLKFTAVKGNEVEVESVVSEQRVGYLKDDSVEVVSVPFRTATRQVEGRDGRMIDMGPAGKSKIMLDIILPNEDTDLSEIASDYLETENYQQMLASMKPTFIAINLPKFKFDFKADLIGVLKRLGVEAAFDSRVADFSKMGKTTNGSNVFISKVIQKTAVELDEKGLKAAAVTAVVMSRESMPITPEISFTANRAFLYTLRDSETNALLFIGQLGNPQTKEQ